MPNIFPDGYFDDDDAGGGSPSFFGDWGDCSGNETGDTYYSYERKPKKLKTTKKGKKMATITGKVEVLMTNKFNADKYAMKLEGNDTWYGQSKEWMEIVPNRGDTVSFSNGKGKDGAEGKYIQYLEILETAAPAQAATSAAPKSFGGNMLGVELGHAANNATLIGTTIHGKNVTLDKIEELTHEFYQMMQRVRETYAPAPKPEPKVEVKAAPAKLDDDFEDDDIPF